MVQPSQQPPSPSDLMNVNCCSQTRPQTHSLAFVTALITGHSSNLTSTRTAVTASLLNRPVASSFSARFPNAAGRMICTRRRCLLPITAMSVAGGTGSGSGSGMTGSTSGSGSSSKSRSPRKDDDSVDPVAKADIATDGSSTSTSTAAAATSVTSPPKRKRGRPKGSKNRKPSRSSRSSSSSRQSASANSINPLMGDDDLQLDIASLQQDFSKLRAPNGIRNSKTEPDDFLQELLPILAADEMRELEGESPEEVDARSILLDLINEMSALDDRQAAANILEDLLGDDDDNDDDDNDNNSNDSDDSNNADSGSEHGHAIGAWNNLRPFKLLNEDDDFKHKQCDACNGSGMVKCLYCNGEGFVDFGENNRKFHADFPDGDMTLPAHVMGNIYHCPLCGGWTKERCVKCLGVGELNHLSWTEERVKQRPKGAARPVDPMWHALDMDKVLEEEGLDRVEYGQDGFIILRAKPRKKGAGRPRKTPAPTATTEAEAEAKASEGSLTEIVSTVTGSDGGGSSSSGSGTTTKLAKRRRGRPRKNEVRDEDLSKAVVEAVKANQTQGEATIVTGGKRGRGRKRSSISDSNRSSSSSSNIDAGADTTTTSSASALPPKALSAKLSTSSPKATAAAAAAGRQQQQRKQDQEEEQQAVSQRRMNESAGATASSASASANTMQLGQEPQNAVDDDDGSSSSDSSSDSDIGISSSPSTDFVNITDYQVSRRLRNIEQGRDDDDSDADEEEFAD